MSGYREEKFIRYFVISCDEGRAESMARLGQSPGVQEEVEVELARLEEESNLKGKYVRDYILSILELCPTDHVRVGRKGAWEATPKQWARVPVEVKRLVEAVDVELDDRGRPVRYRIRFISKLGALAIAARYTLTERHEVKTNVPWERIARAAEREVQDTVAERLGAYEDNGIHLEDQRD
jgi:hypothetical protein